MIKFVTDLEIYKKVVLERVPSAKDFLWIGTADIKDMYVHKGSKMVPFLQILSDLIQNDVNVRLIHAKEPGPNFMKDFDRFPVLFEGLERLLCPRVHFKSVIIDGQFAFSGSANLTGSGMGAKSAGKRNFESGFITTDPELVHSIMEQFDNVWMGKFCKECSRKEFCSEITHLG